jgi:hypothetical protein
VSNSRNTNKTTENIRMLKTYEICLVHKNKKERKKEKTFISSTSAMLLVFYKSSEISKFGFK